MIALCNRYQNAFTQCSEWFATCSDNYVPLHIENKLFRAGETPGTYELTRPATLEEIISFTRNRLSSRFKRSDYITSPEITKDFLRAKMALLEYEVFAAIHLDNRHGVLDYEELFRGTVDGASVHPREVVKSALRHNAAALVLAHNHPLWGFWPKPSKICTSDQPVA